LQDLPKLAWDYFEGGDGKVLGGEKVVLKPTHLPKSSPELKSQGHCMK